MALAVPRQGVATPGGFYPPRGVPGDPGPLPPATGEAGGPEGTPCGVGEGGHGEVRGSRACPVREGLAPYP